MRLLKRSTPDGGFQLKSFNDDDVPPYAILSHTWNEGQEVTYLELNSGAGQDKTGYSKLLFCGQQAAADSLEHFWVDTCCIDKSTSDELGTAINSMFRWYQRASRCYVYLSDVSVPSEVEDAEAFRITWREAFRRSRWFTRGWTLQELIAPASVEFFSKEGKRLGSKISLEQEIHEITKIPIEALRGQNLNDFSVEERMQWTSGRTTTMKEDKVYCLLGIFGVFLALIYGEGEAYASLRLSEEIEKRHKVKETDSLHDSTAASLLPFPRNELFVGREGQLRSLEQFLLAPNFHRRMTIHGLGGCGKSALALEFAYRALQRGAKSLVFWVPALSQDSFKEAYRDIGNHLRVPGITEDNADIIQLVNDKLRSPSSGDWLMIVDNADDPEVLFGRASVGSVSARSGNFLPHTSRGTILFTTRSRKVAGILTQSNVLELSDMKKSGPEARELLANRLANKELLDDEKAVDELLDILEYLPLAIVQAAAFMNNNDVSVSQYAALFQHASTENELFSEDFDDSSRYQETDSTIARTWHISFEQIRKQDPLAAEYLAFMACIDRINIPQSILPPGGSLVQQIRALGTLTGYAFITERQNIVKNERVFDMHRLVHMASVSWLDSHCERGTWVDTAIDRLKDIIPDEKDVKEGAWVMYLSHATHVAGIGMAMYETAGISLLSQVGLCQSNLGQFAAAESSLRQALSLQERLFGVRHPQTLFCMAELGSAIMNQGRYEEAESLGRQTLALSEKILGLDHNVTLIAMSDLAFGLARQCKYVEAESLYKETLVRREASLGANHPYTLNSRNNLAEVLGQQGKQKEAESIHRETLAQREKDIGPGHIDTLSSKHNMAGLLHGQGKFEEAESEFRQVLAQLEVMLGPKHPFTLTVMHNLATVLGSQRRYAEAELLLRQTLQYREALLGSDHPDTLSDIYYIAYLLSKQQRFDESVVLWERACAGYRAVLGDNHPETEAVQKLYSEALAEKEKYDTLPLK